VPLFCLPNCRQRITLNEKKKEHTHTHTAHTHPHTHTHTHTHTHHTHTHTHTHTYQPAACRYLYHHRQTFYVVILVRGWMRPSPALPACRLDTVIPPQGTTNVADTFSLTRRLRVAYLNGTDLRATWLHQSWIPACRARLRTPAALPVSGTPVLAAHPVLLTVLVLGSDGIYGRIRYVTNAVLLPYFAFATY